MDLDYQKRYNEHAVEAGEAFNTECLQYLDDHFSQNVIDSLHTCLKEKPSKPVVFIAEKLQQTLRENSSPEAKGAKSSGEHISCVGEISELCFYYSGGVYAELKPLVHFGKPPERISPDVPVAKLPRPTSYDIITAMQYLEVEGIMSRRKTAVLSTNDGSIPSRPSTQASVRTFASISPPLLLIVEPPAVSSEVVFIKGIPYAHTLREGLQYQYRRGNTSAPLPEEGQSFSEKALELLKSSISPTDVHSLSETLDQILTNRDELSTAANKSVNESLEEAPLMQNTTRWELVQLPSIQQDCLEIFNLIDNGFRKVTEACKDCLPTVLFVSYQEDATSSLTFARIISAFFPYFERFQLDEMKMIRQENLLRVRRYDLEFCLAYWNDTHRRREQRDRLHGTRTEIHGKRFTVNQSLKFGSLRFNSIIKREKNASSLNGSPSMQTDLFKSSPEATDTLNLNSDFSATEPMGRYAKKDMAQTIDSLATSQFLNTSQKTTTLGRSRTPKRYPSYRFAREEASPEVKEFLKKILEDRKQRRGNEDSAYLAVVRAHQDTAATRIQALFRGSRVRARPPSASLRARKENLRRDSPELLNILESPPPNLPPLIELFANRLQSLHRDLFGPYTPSAPPQPKAVVIYVPSRQTITFHGPKAAEPEEAKEKDVREGREELNIEVESEVEEWAAETVLVPSRRHTQLRPHFNPLHRLLEYYKLTGSTVLTEAIELMIQCTGMTMLQRQAYDKLKSVVLDLMHVAYTELYHRQRLSTLSDPTFSNYVRYYHDEVLAWFSRPHLLSLASRQSVREGSSGSVDHENFFASSVNWISRGTSYLPPVLATKEGVQYERMLVCGGQGPKLNERMHLKPEDEDSATTLSPKRKPLQRLVSRVHWLPPTASLATVNRFLHYLSHNERGTSRKRPESCADGNPEKPPAPGERPDQKPLDLLWCNLCAYPTCYVDGDLFLLVPRQSRQEVEGRATYDEYVMRRKIQRNLKYPVEPLNGAKTHSVETEKIYTDTLPSQMELEKPVVAPIELPHLSNCFRCSLVSEDEHLKMLLSKNKSEKGLTLPHYAPILGETRSTYMFGGAPRAPCGGREGRSRVSEQPRELPSVQVVKSCPSFRQKFYTFVNRENEVARRRLMASFTPEECTLESKPPSLLQDPLQCSPPTAWQELSDLTKLDCQSSLPLMTSSSILGQKALKMEGLVRTPHEALQDLVSCLKESGCGSEVALTYFRPWIPTLPAGNLWLRLFEKLINTMHERLTTGGIIVLCADMGENQTIFVASALLLSAALGYDAFPPSNAAESNRHLCFPSHSAGGTKLFSQDLSFLNDFLDLLSSHFSNIAIPVDDSVKLVNAILQTLHTKCSLSFTLDTITARIQAAERQPSCDACRQLILSVVRDTEHYCWLILFALFSEFSFAKGSSMHFGRVSLTSFENFVHSIPNVLHWIYSIDPWMHSADKCPDSTHTRYSNGLRRWDSEDYICFGVV